MKSAFLGLVKPMQVSVLALVIASVGLIGTTAVAEASTMEPFGAVGVLTDIDAGDVVPAGTSGRFVVKDRVVLGGLLFGNISGDLSFEYGTNVPITTQSGQIHGQMTVDDPTLGLVSASVTGQSSLGVCSLPDSPPIAGLIVEGTFTLLNGQPGHGEFIACVYPLIEDGHIVDLIGGLVSMSGQWKP